MFQLGNLAEQQTPLLTDLHAAAPGLNKLATNLPAFNNGTEQSLTSLGGAAQVGKTALANSKEEIAALDQASTKAYPAADQVAQFLESISDPKNAVEEDCLRPLRPPRAAGAGGPARPAARPEARHHSPRRPDRHLQVGQRHPVRLEPTGGNPGYTGMEGLLNYAYVQTNSLNLFDQLGHALGITLVSAPGTNAPCGYQTGPTVPAEGGGQTTDPRHFAECAGILGDKQPGINYGTNPSGLFGNLGRYDPSVCPDGSDQLSICNPADSPHTAAGLRSATTAPAQPQRAPQQQPAPTPEQQKEIDKILKGVDPNKIPDNVKKKLQELLPPGVTLPQLPQAAPAAPAAAPSCGQGLGLNGSTPPSGSTPRTSSTSSSANDLRAPLHIAEVLR